MNFEELCGMSPSIGTMVNVMFIIGYGMMTALYITFGLSGYITLLVSFYKQAKQEPAYAYQVFLTVSKTFEILFFSLFIIGYKWASGAEHEGWSWYRRNYILMFFAAYIGCPVFNAMIISSIYCAVAMTTDRVLCLSKPFIYNNLNHKRHQIISAVVCFSIGLLTNLFEIKHLTLEKSSIEINGTWDGFYLIKYDEVYLSYPVVRGLNHFRTSVRLIGIVALISLNIVMVIIFHKHAKEVGHMVAGDEQRQKRAAANKALLILTVYQSCLIAVNQIAQMIVFGWQIFNICWIIILAPFVDGFVQFSDTIEFFVLITLNKRLRNTILGVLPQSIRERLSSITT